MSEKHSPGPWRACGAHRGGCKCGLIWSITDDVVVAEVTKEDGSHKKTDEQFHANAALIASAPKLAADLDAANKRIGVLEEQLRITRDGLKDMREEMEALG